MNLCSDMRSREEDFGGSFSSGCFCKRIVEGPRNGAGACEMTERFLYSCVTNISARKIWETVVVPGVLSFEGRCETTEAWSKGVF